MAESRNKNLIKAISNALVNGKITTAGVLVPDIVEDVTPQLGGNLDVNGSDIVSTSDGNIDILPNGAGKVNLDGNGSTGGITVSDGLIEMRTGTGSVASIDMYCEVNNAHKVTIKPPAHANYSGNVTFQLPSSNGTNGYVLQTNGSGVTSWVAQTGGDVVDDTSPQLGGDLDVNGNAIVSASNGNIAITPNGSGSVIIDGLSHPQADGNAGQVLKTDGNGQLAFASVNSLAGAGIQNVSDDSSPQLGGNLDVVTHSIVSTSNRDINITPNGAGKVVLDGLSYPTADGSADQVLTTNGSGTLSFADAASSAATPYQYTATAGQTTFSGSDANGNTLSYDSGKTLVYQNGVLLTPVDDYTATSGSTVILQTGADVNDVIIIAALGTAQATVNSASTTNVLYEHSNSISSAYSISSGNNALSAGPITVETGGSVLVPTGSSWVVV